MASIVASASERTESESGSHVTSFISGNEAEATAVTSASASTEDNAEEESPYAMHGRGVRMFTGKDQPKDQAGAVAVWKECVAKHNWAPSRVLLGMACWSGEGCPEDVEAGIGWLREAGRNGGAEGAQGAFFLGMAYTKGDKVEKDPSRGLRWLRQAAKSHHREAMYELGAIMIATDDPEQVSRGCDWINAAAEKGHSRALQFLKTAKEATRQGGKAAYPLPTPEQIIKMDEADKAAATPGNRGGGDEDDWVVGVVPSGAKGGGGGGKKKGKKGRGK